MIACYLELHEEGKVKHINGPTHPDPLYNGFTNPKVKGVKMRVMHQQWKKVTEELSLLLDWHSVELLKTVETLTLPSLISHNNLPVNELWSLCVTTRLCTWNFTQLTLLREHVDASILVASIMILVPLPCIPVIVTI